MMDQARLGLVWERDLLDPEITGEDKAILLDLIEEENGMRLSWPENDSGNVLIEGDNLDALRVLAKTHKGKIDCIFIDPPYNTGKNTFIYNDRFVDKDHRWRKSLWLEFMHKRLLLARDLLSPSGVILVAINDKHRSLMELLLEEVNTGCRIGSFVWRSRQGKNEVGDANLSVNHEHILVYGNKNFEFGGRPKTFAAYKFDDSDGRGPYDAGNMTVSVKYDDKRAGKAYYPIQDPQTGVWYPANPDRVWAYARSRADLKRGQKIKTRTMEEFINDNKVRFPAGERIHTWSTLEDLLASIDAGDVPVNGKGSPLLRRGLPDLDFFVGKPVGWGTPRFKRHLADVKNKTQPISSWIHSTADRNVVTVEGDNDVVELSSALTSESEGHLKAALGAKLFNYAKPPSLMTEIIRQATAPDSIVLDFFAGSATTAEAVLRVNAEDGGARRFIMVSSTEATQDKPNKNVARDVAAPRIIAVIKGFRKGKQQIEGTGDGFTYLRAKRVPQVSMRRHMTDAHVWTNLCLREHHPITKPSLINGISVQETETSVLIWCPEPDDKS
ncbi:MAG: site-specific DNA-methyltransferase [Paracoccus sp.]|nr:site-specific DNA-methyltransferase [Paracoccus sp. (in: a-proteobacteria)]